MDGGKESSDCHLQADEEQEDNGVADEEAEKGLLDPAGGGEITDGTKASDQTDEDCQHRGQRYGPVGEEATGFQQSSSVSHWLTPHCTEGKACFNLACSLRYGNSKAERSQQNTRVDIAA